MAGLQDVLLILSFDVFISRNSYELEALQETLAEVKGNIHSPNVGKFENCVEVHMKHIQSGLSQVRPWGCGTSVVRGPLITR